MAAYAQYLWFGTRRFQEPEREVRVRRRAATWKRRIAGKTIVVFEWGEPGAPAVLLVHGWNGRGNQLGAFVEPLSRAGYRVIAFDGPAHGRSTGDRTDIEEFADVIQTLADTHGPFAALISHSFGVVAATLTLRQGVQAEAFIGIAPPAGVEVLLRRFSDLLEVPEVVMTRLYARMCRRYGRDFAERFSMQQLVAGLDTPALIVHDRDDRDVPWQEGRAVAGHWPGAEWRLTERLGHRRILRDPSTVQSLVDWLGRPRRGASD